MLFTRNFGEEWTNILGFSRCKWVPELFLDPSYFSSHVNTNRYQRKEFWFCFYHLSVDFNQNTSDFKKSLVRGRKKERDMVTITYFSWLASDSYKTLIYLIKTFWLFVLMVGYTLLCSNTAYTYLPTPRLGLDMTQGQFLSGVYQVWIQSFLLLDFTKAKEHSLSYYLP